MNSTIVFLVLNSVNFTFYNKQVAIIFKLFLYTMLLKENLLELFKEEKQGFFF